MSSKKVLFLEINSSYSHSMLSYGMIRAYCEQQLPEWQWLHTEATVKNSVDDVAGEVAGQSPDVVLATAYIFNLTVLLKVCTLIKAQLPGVVIVFGGPTFLGDNKDFLRDNPQISGVMRGDESSAPQLLETSPDNVEYIPGFCWIDTDGVYCDNGIAEFSGELDLLPSPFQTGLIAVDKPFCQLETSRGCNGKCQFCTSSESNGVKCFSLERCRTDLLAIRASGINEVRLIDRTFNDRAERAIALLDMFREEFSTMKFHLEINPAKLNIEILERLKQAPVDQLHIEIGVQSLNPQVLQRIKRPASVPATLAGLEKLLRIERFELHADLIAGLPEQHIDDVIADVEQLMVIGPHEVQLENLKLLPGTTLRRELPVGYRFNPQPLWEVTETPTMSVADLDYAARLSYVIDSWYNTPQLHKCWRFAFNLIPNMLVEFCKFVADEITLQRGKLPLEKRFILLEKFCHGKSTQAAELCRFSMIANGFVHPDYKTVKAVEFDAEHDRILWSLPEKHRVRRYITMSCSFNAGDFFVGNDCEIIDNQHDYIFSLFYGRNVCEILQK
jgi:Radical SAM superfamily/B12 binding domain